MPKANQILVPEELAKFLGVREKEINAKLQNLIDQRVGQSPDDLLAENRLAEDYMKVFSKEEILAILFHTMMESGFMNYKFYQLAEFAQLSDEQINAVLNMPLMTDEEIAETFKRDKFEGLT